jgi:hypothetical protein
MSKASGKPPRKAAIRRVEATAPSQAEFDEVLALIDAAKARAFAAVNTTLIDLYWQLGEYISHKIADATWGSGPSRPWPNASSGAIRGGAGSRPATSGACGNSSRLTATRQNSQRCCENCRGATTWRS